MVIVIFRANQDELQARCLVEIYDGILDIDPVSKKKRKKSKNVIELPCGESNPGHGGESAGS